MTFVELTEHEQLNSEQECQQLHGTVHSSISRLGDLAWGGLAETSSSHLPLLVLG